MNPAGRDAGTVLSVSGHTAAFYKFYALLAVTQTHVPHRHTLISDTITTQCSRRARTHTDTQAISVVLVFTEVSRREAGHRERDHRRTAILLQTARLHANSRRPA